MKKCILSLFFHIAVSISAIAQSVTIHSFDIVHNYLKNGEKGLLLKATFTVHGMKGKVVGPTFFITDKKYNIAKAPNGKQLFMVHKLTADYQDTKWTDVQTFVSYNVLPNVAGTQDYMAVILFYDINSQTLTIDNSSCKNEINFTCTKSQTQNVPQYIPSNPQYTPAEPPICYKCKGVGYYYINGTMYTCSQCGGGGRDWNSPAY